MRVLAFLMVAAILYFLLKIIFGSKIHEYGRVIAVSEHKLFDPHEKKKLYFFLHSQPYQLGQTLETVIRVETQSGCLLDFKLFGNYFGMFRAGDQVEIYANRKRVVKKIYNHTTASRVKAPFQFSPDVLKKLILLPLVLILFVLMIALSDIQIAKILAIYGFVIIAVVAIIAFLIFVTLKDFFK